KVARHRVHGVGEVLPGTSHAAHLGLAAELALRAHLAGDPSHLGREGVELIHHGIDRVLQLEDLTTYINGSPLEQVAGRDGGGDVGDVAHLTGEVAGHHVHGVGEVLPGAADAADFGLAAELPLGTDLTGHAGHLGRERVELIHHGVDGVLQLEDLTAYINR